MIESLDQISDIDLLALWRRAEDPVEAERASRLLYRRHKQMVTRFFLCKGCGGDPADLIAQTFAELFRRSDATIVVDNFRGLLMIIAARVFFAHLRQKAKRQREEIDFTEVCLARLNERSPSSGVHRRHTLEQLHEDLRQIPVASQLLIELKYFAGLGDRDLATALDVPSTTLPGRQRRALAELVHVVNCRGSNGVPRRLAAR